MNLIKMIRENYWYFVHEEDHDVLIGTKEEMDGFMNEFLDTYNENEDKINNKTMVNLIEILGYEYFKTLNPETYNWDNKYEKAIYEKYIHY